ncbi:hypothetical protein J437_LFUL005693 [Ladona fulva]|uniref:Cuticle protein n=1 Tax=Ladona fulva TaxID=123851 RepID=A0A8K0K642_LADFU|nr:hypothetical protein J437_LFUL005693 [Ladona fulva]
MAVCSKAAVVPEATATVKSLEAARPDFDPTPQYSFSYDVSDSKTGDTKAQTETRTGDVVKGSYSVVEPDGTRRTVYYVASPENGFQAVIRRDSPLEAILLFGVCAVFALAEAGLVPALGRVVAPGAVAVAPAVAAIDPHYDPNPQYTFAYGVSDALTGDHKRQHETRSGDVVYGTYSLVEPDGLVRTVNYAADPINGFNAVVRREPVVIAPQPAVAAVPGRVLPAALAVKPVLRLLVLTSILAMVYAGVLEHPAISYVSAPKLTLATVPSFAVAPKIAAPAYSYYAAAAPKIEYAKVLTAAPALSYAAPALSYAAPATKLSFAAAPALTYAAAAPKISFAAAPAVHFAPALPKVFLPAAAPKIAFAPTHTVSYVSAPSKVSFGVAPAIALPKYAVAPPVISYAPSVKVVDAGSYDPNPEYSYSYEVDDKKSGDQKSAHESRAKDGTVTGSYSVTEPDGSKRTVDYTADHINGYKATVHREEAQQDVMKMVEKKMKEDAKQMGEAMKKGAVMVMPHPPEMMMSHPPEMLMSHPPEMMMSHPPEMMMVMKTEDAHHAMVMKH